MFEVGSQSDDDMLGPALVLGGCIIIVVINAFQSKTLNEILGALFGEVDVAS
jgi:hypothetical protein